MGIPCMQFAYYALHYRNRKSSIAVWYSEHSQAKCLLILMEVWHCVVEQIGPLCLAPAT